jgi:hypothetical protein
MPYPRHRLYRICDVPISRLCHTGNVDRAQVRFPTAFGRATESIRAARTEATAQPAASAWWS